MTPAFPDSAPRALSESAASGDAVAPHRWTLLYALILVVAFGLRVSSLTVGLDLSDPDEALLDGTDERAMATSIREALLARDLNPRDFLNRGPAGFLVFLAVDAPVVGLLSLRHPGGLEGLVQDLKDNPSLLIGLHRGISMVFGMLTVILLVRVVRREFGERAALWSGALMAVCYLNVRDSLQGRVDAMWGCFCLFAVSRLLLLLREPTLRRHVQAGLACGAALAMKYPGGLLLAPLVASHGLAHLAARRESRPAPPLSSLLAALVAFPIGLLLFFPGIVVAWGDLVHTFSRDLAVYAPSPHLSERLKGLWTHVRYSFLAGFGESALLAALIGIGPLLRRGPRGWLVLTALLGIAPILVATSIVVPRLAEPMVVLLCIPAGLALAALHGRLPTWGAGFVGALALLPSLARSASFDWVMNQLDTRLEMRDELQRRDLPAKDVLALGLTHSLPHATQRSKRLYQPYLKIRFGGRLTGARKVADDYLDRLDELLRDPPRLILICESERDEIPDIEGFHELVKVRYREVLRLDGRRGDFTLPSKIGTEMVPYESPWLMRRPGSALVLYERIDPAPESGSAPESGADSGD